MKVRVSLLGAEFDVISFPTILEVELNLLHMPCLKPRMGLLERHQNSK